MENSNQQLAIQQQQNKLLGLFEQLEAAQTSANQHQEQARQAESETIDVDFIDIDQQILRQQQEIKAKELQLQQQQIELAIQQEKAKLDKLQEKAMNWITQAGINETRTVSKTANGIQAKSTTTKPVSEDAEMWAFIFYLAIILGLLFVIWQIASDPAGLAAIAIIIGGGIYIAKLIKESKATGKELSK
jgi:RNase adaptor protein for sRNA GlmZ degradation